MHQTSKEKKNGREVNTKYRKERKKENESKKEMNWKKEKNEWMTWKERDKQTKEKLYKILKTKKKGQTNFLMEDVLLRNKNWKDKVEKKKRNKTCKKYKMKKEKVQ